MLPEGTVEARDVWKRFRSTRQRRQLRDAAERAKSRLRGRGPSWRWALRDVELVAQPGESVGLVGANGSGKSTLLKILTRVMHQYAGTVTVAGRVGALIEVSAGIHPELTGRENVELYGSLLGVPRRKVVEHFDEIVAFAEVEAAIDRQVKFYSSGMKMRLGFAVAAFLEPAVLLVDEVLAVGDASFQQKCLGQMRGALDAGTTLIFVSHDLAAVEATCSRVLWLAGGEVQADGPATESMRAYRESIEQVAEALPWRDGPVKLRKVLVEPVGYVVATTGGSVDIRIAMESDVGRRAALHLGISEGPATPVFSVRHDVALDAGETTVVCRMERLPLPRGRFYLWLGLFAPRRDAGTLLEWHPVAHFDVVGPDLDTSPPAVVRLSPVHVDATWSIGS